MKIKRTIITKGDKSLPTLRLTMKKAPPKPNPQDFKNVRIAAKSTKKYS